MNFSSRTLILFTTIVALLFIASEAAAQSTNQDYPTPVTSNEISGTIPARDVGDARLTSYFYQFDGDQGDLFINIVTRNFTGDIDLFTLSGLRPLTKIVVYADFAESETGRVIYLRKPEKMILRVQGRTPGDDPAMFRIKFAGSFLASTMQEPPAEPSLPSLTAKNESGIRVNSVGTIVEIIPKATPSPSPADVPTGVVDERSEVPETEKRAEQPEPTVAEIPAETPVDEEPKKKVEVVVTDNLPEKTETSTPPVTSRRTTRGRRRTPPAKAPPADITEKPSTPADTTPPPVTRTRRGRTRPDPEKAAEPDPMEKVNLLILFKDGSTIARPMSEVLRFTVDKGVLTVIAKDGSIGRYSILDVAKVTIE
jgi:hypothetical protein